MSLLFLFLLFNIVRACQLCSLPQSPAVLTRHVRRSQPGASDATLSPRGPLEWGEINFLQTTDTHGWLAGHLKDRNYGADWGDFVSFTKKMRQKASELGVDLLLVDTGDLHDGSGLSDSEEPSQILSIFENVDYDLLTIGNHELRVSAVAYEHFNHFAKLYGDKYLTSNVEIINPSTGLRIMSFGVIFDFEDHTNTTRITKAIDMVKEQWFIEAVNYHEPIDLFVVLGHNPIRRTDKYGTIGFVYDAIRNMSSNTPIQVFGGHSHIRDFVVYDNRATGLESGQYCETVGWLSINGIANPFQNESLVHQVPISTRLVYTSPNTQSSIAPNSLAPLYYARRYLDWNRLTFEYHAKGSQSTTFDTLHGRLVTAMISETRDRLNLSLTHGCAPQNWCKNCLHSKHNGNTYTLFSKVASEILVNKNRANLPRVIILNGPNLRSDLLKGPFTNDDAFAIMPDRNPIRFIPNVPYSTIQKALTAWEKSRDTENTNGSIKALALDSNFPGHERCFDPDLKTSSKDTINHFGAVSQIIRRTAEISGYTTKDDFGTDGDDTIHAPTGSYKPVGIFHRKVSFPEDGSSPHVVDLIFIQHLEAELLKRLTQAGVQYSSIDVLDYLPRTSFTSHDMFPEYARRNWQSGMPNCTIEDGMEA